MQNCEFESHGLTPWCRILSQLIDGAARSDCFDYHQASRLIVPAKPDKIGFLAWSETTLASSYPRHACGIHSRHNEGVAQRNVSQTDSVANGMIYAETRAGKAGTTAQHDASVGAKFYLNLSQLVESWITHCRHYRIGNQNRSLNSLRAKRGYKKRSRNVDGIQNKTRGQAV